MKLNWAQIQCYGWLYQRKWHPKVGGDMRVLATGLNDEAQARACTFDRFRTDCEYGVSVQRRNWTRDASNGCSERMNTKRKNDC